MKEQIHMRFYLDTQETHLLPDWAVAEHANISMPEAELWGSWKVENRSRLPRLLKRTMHLITLTYQSIKSLV